VFGHSLAALYARDLIRSRDRAGLLSSNSIELPDAYCETSMLAEELVSSSFTSNHLKSPQITSNCFLLLLRGSATNTALPRNDAKLSNANIRKDDGNSPNGHYLQRQLQQFTPTPRSCCNSTASSRSSWAMMANSKVSDIALATVDFLKIAPKISGPKVSRPKAPGSKAKSMSTPRP